MVTEQESESSRGQQSHTLLLSVLSAVFVAFLFLSASLHLTFFFILFHHLRHFSGSHSLYEFSPFISDSIFSFSSALSGTL